MTALVHYAEIGLKGRNRAFFEDKLIQSIRRAARTNGVLLEDVSRQSGRLICHFAGASEEAVAALLRTVFGIKYFALAHESSNDEEALLAQTRSLAQEAIAAGKKTVAVAARRIDNRYPIDSGELNCRLGAEANRCGLKINLDNPDLKIFLQVGAGRAYFYTRKIPGLGGLPVASSGRVLALLSGGIDSPVAAWLLMKRGCQVDFLHFHTLADNRDVLATKIWRLVEELGRYQNPSRLFLIPYHNYQIRTLGRIPEKVDLIAFKNFMLRVAQKVAVKNRCRALVTGDSVGQVASQTLQNIAATDDGLEMPVLRPLVGFDKQEIVDLAQRVGTFEQSIRDYKDCCSIIARRPSTAVQQDELRTVIETPWMKSALERTLAEVEVFRFKHGATNEPVARAAMPQAEAPVVEAKG